jgi:hypothetical protein
LIYFPKTDQKKFLPKLVTENLSIEPLEMYEVEAKIQESAVNVTTKY